MATVRNMLLSLPKVECPAGFEYRLNRRLQGEGVQRRAAGRSWVSGWLGVGLGFACAVGIALFAFDFNPAAPTSQSLASKTQQAAPSRSGEPVMEPLTQTGASGPLTVPQPESPMASTDSVPLKADPTHISSDRLQQVSNEESAPANR